jgi:hypothetical protein
MRTNRVTNDRKRIGRRGGIARQGTQEDWDNLPPAEFGDTLRARIIVQMDENHCGGCGQEALCKQIAQHDERFPHVMWLCGECLAMQSPRPGEYLWH